MSVCSEQISLALVPVAALQSLNPEVDIGRFPDWRTYRSSVLIQDSLSPLQEHVHVHTRMLKHKNATEPDFFLMQQLQNPTATLAPPPGSDVTGSVIQIQLFWF